MATRGRATFQKRQKEIARKEKQQRKAARRAQRKLDAADPHRIGDEDDGSIQPMELGEEPQE